MKYNITIRNNDVVALSGLRIAVRIFSGVRPISSGFGSFSPRFDMLLAGEEVTAEGSIGIDDNWQLYNTTTTDLEFLVTLKSGDVIVDEQRLSGIPSPF